MTITSTIGVPSVVAALTWVAEVLDKK